MTGVVSNNCRLFFLRHWSPTNHLWGLKMTDVEVAIDRNLFSCCGGSGVLVETSQSRDAQLCGLSRRWHLIANLLAQKNRSSGESILPNRWIKESLTSTQLKTLEALFASHLSDFLNGGVGKVFALPASPGNACSRIDDFGWILAATLAWHFELVVLVADLRVLPIPLNHWQDLMTRFHKSKVIVLVDGAEELWNPTRLEALELVIAFASEKCIPVWIHQMNLSTPASKTEGGSTGEARARSFRSQISKRIADQKQKPVVHWLSDHGKSRLRELCRFYEISGNSTKIPDIL